MVHVTNSFELGHALALLIQSELWFAAVESKEIEDPAFGPSENTVQGDEYGLF